jgi:hypothetical protein
MMVIYRQDRKGLLFTVCREAFQQWPQVGAIATRLNCLHYMGKMSVTIAQDTLAYAFLALLTVNCSHCYTQRSCQKC